ncbi:MAG: amidohydrolase [Desulfovibrionales bacterium]
MHPCDTVIQAGICLTQNSEREILHDAGIAILKGEIQDIGPFDRIVAAYDPKESLDLSHCLVLPGLINAHTHASMTVFRGLADDLPLMQWLTGHIFPVEKHLTPEIVRLGAMLACAEMVRTGTTCFCDMYLLERDVARAVVDCGMRALVAEGLFMFPSPAYEDLDTAYRLVGRLQELAESHTRLKNGLMPHAIYSTTPEILKKSFRLAEQYDTIWLMHLAETAHETTECMNTHGKRPLAYLDELGLLSPRSVFAHGVDLNDSEIELLARTGAKVVHNPESNMKLSSGVAPVQRMLQAGVCVGLGTDGAASNNDLNMLTEMGTCALLQKVTTMDPTAVSAQAALDMATVNGARCLGWPEIGSLEPGKAADLTALSLNAPNMAPLHNPVSQVVYAANGGEVTLTMVEGRILYRDGSFPTMDYPGLLKEIDAVAKWVRGKRNSMA